MAGFTTRTMDPDTYARILEAADAAAIALAKDPRAVAVRARQDEDRKAAHAAADKAARKARKAARKVRREELAADALVPEWLLTLERTIAQLQLTK